MTRIIAVDWSGRQGPAQAEAIWRADVRDGELVDLRCGADREQVVDGLAAVVEQEDEAVVGLDFGFSLPAWWLQEQGLGEAAEVWSWARDHGEAVLENPSPPFFGGKGTTAPDESKRLRRTERELRAAGFPAKSVFGLAGAGAVGTGSLRGMPKLLQLTEAGFAIWPFHAPRPHQVVEIYPRVLTGPVDKGSFTKRQAYLRERFSDRQDPLLLERAAGSEDAFDAAVSALTMSEHVSELGALEPAIDAETLLEGQVWRPSSASARPG